MARSFLASSLLIAAATFLSRLAGLLRDILFAAFLGASASADAFIAAFRLPNLFRRLFAEGSFSSAFVPVYAGLDETSARRFAGAVLFCTGIFLLVFTLLAEIFMPVIMVWLAGGFVEDEEKFTLAVFYARLMFPYLAAMSLTAFYSAILHSARRFIAAASAPFLLNACLIAAFALAAFLTAGQQETARFLSLAAGLAGLLQLGLVMLACHKAALAPHLPVPSFWRDMFADNNLRRFGKLLIPMLVVGGATQLNIIIGTRIASSSAGAISWLYFAERLYQLPLALIGIAIGIALLPDLVRHQNSGDEKSQRQAMGLAIEYAMLLALPAAFALALMPAPVLAAFFFFGAFSEQDLAQSARALAGFALGLPAFIAVKILAAGFFAQKDMVRPLFFTFAAIGLNCWLALAFFSQWGVLAIALASSAAAWLQAGLLGGFLVRQNLLALRENQLASKLARMILASALMGGAVGWLANYSWFAHYHAPLWRLFALGLLVLAGLVLYGALCQMLNLVSPTSLKLALTPPQESAASSRIA